MPQPHEPLILVNLLHTHPVFRVAYPVPDVKILRRKWGNVFSFGGHGGTRKRDYAGVQKITLNLPF